MSSNFLNTAGGFAGCDMHLYLMLGVPPAVPFPMPFTSHYVEQIHLIGDSSKKVPSVTTTGTSVLQQGWKMLVVPHVFLTVAPPHPTEWINLAAIIILGQSEPKLAASTVRGQGEPLLVEALEAIGVNLDCSDNWIGFGADINPNTVKTTPTPGDYVSAVVWTALGSLSNQLWGKNSKYNANAVFRKHSKGQPRIDTISDAVKAQVKASMRNVVQKEGQKVAVDKGMDWLKDQMPDGVMEDAVTGAISTFFG
jgi:hypothetical protein